MRLVVAKIVNLRIAQLQQMSFDPWCKAVVLDGSSEPVGGGNFAPTFLFTILNHKTERRSQSWFMG